MNQSSEATEPTLHPPSSPATQTTAHHHKINQEREGQISPLVPTKEDQLSNNVNSGYPSSSSSYISSNPDQVPLPEDPAPPWELKPHFPGLLFSTPGETSPRSQEDPVTLSRALDPIFEMVRGQDLGRHALVLVIPIVIFLRTTYNPLNMSIYFTLPVILLCIGLMVIWNGIVLRRVFPHASKWIEIVGISLVLLAFYSTIARFLPGYTAWIPFFCWFLTLIPFIVTIFSKKEGNGQPGGASHKSSVPLLPL